MGDKLGWLGAGLGMLIAIALIAAQLALIVGGLAYRKECVGSEGQITKEWTFTWMAPIPYVFRPSETGCVVHTGTRVALDGVGIASFSETTSTKIAEETIPEESDARTTYWVKARSALEDYFRRNSAPQTSFSTALKSIDTVLIQFRVLDVPAGYEPAHNDVVSALRRMKQHGEELQAAAKHGDETAYRDAKRNIGPDAENLQTAIERLQRFRTADK